MNAGWLARVRWWLLAVSKPGGCIVDHNNRRRIKCDGNGRIDLKIEDPTVSGASVGPLVSKRFDELSGKMSGRSRRAASLARGAGNSSFVDDSRTVADIRGKIRGDFCRGWRSLGIVCLLLFAQGILVLAPQPRIL